MTNKTTVTSQPAPNNDPNGVPIWPLIISELQIAANASAELASSKYGIHSDATRAKTLQAMIVDAKERHEFGINKYGVPLVAKNDRDHLVDAYQELLDALVYLRADIEKHGGLPVNSSWQTPRPYTVQVYEQILDHAIELRAIIAERSTSCIEQ